MVRAWSIALLFAVACGPVEEPAGVISRIDGQDGICSTGGPWLNEDQCTVTCCEAHDRCYVDHGCSAASWAPLTSPPECVECNMALLNCLAQPPCADDADDARKGLHERCESTTDCQNGLLCGDPDCDGVGQCVEQNSGADGTCCTVTNDCASAVCIDGRCVTPFLSPS